MLRSHSNREPTFLWQAVLILLPVVVMSAIGLVAIIRDKAAVEQQARQRAAEMADQFASGLGKRVAAHLAAYDLVSLAWLKHHRDLAEKTWSFPLRDSYTNRLAEWLGTNPGLAPEDVFPNRLSFTSNGVASWPPDYVQSPWPPPWFLEMTREQHQAWDALLHAELTASDLTNADTKFRQFLDSKPTAEARANADFIWLRTRLARQTGVNPVRELERFADDYRGSRSESGLPLLSLVAAEALRLVRQSGEAKTIFATTSGSHESALNEILAWLLDEPSVLTPGLIAQLESLLNSHAIEAEKFAVPIRAAEALWSAQERLHEISETICRRAALRGSTVTNFWIQSPSSLWFCAATSDQIALPQRDPDGVIGQRTNNVTSVRIYPKPVVEQAFARAVQDIGISIPDYLDLNVQLENETLGHASGRSGAAKVLAETRGRLGSLPGSGIADPTPARHSGADSEIEVLPSAPKFTVQIRLTNPELLFATQRQRTWLFGGVIMASSFAALIGLLAAYRSFRRQVRLSELKSNFVSSISHELRAPIASVRLMAESLESGKVSEVPRQREYFRFIVQECRRLSSLIENVLDFSRIERGRKQFEFEPTDLLALTRETVKLMESYAAERQVQLALVADGAQFSTLDPQFSAEGRALQQALVNLIDNAIKHSPKGETVTVGLDVRNAESGMRDEEAKGSSPARLALWVEDHGKGIPPAEHQKIFERFYRLGSELRRETQGVGIGLSIVKHVVEAHGGRVSVRSDVGKGSRFTIEMPMVTPPPKSEIRNPKAE